MKTYFSQLYGFIIRYCSFPDLVPACCSFRGGEENFVKGTKQPISYQAKRGWCVAIFLCGFSTGCITDATVDLTRAPFDASTELTDATTGAITKLTDGTSQATTDLRAHKRISL